ncbi:MAG: porin family protein [Cyclobacteriaceae bacterium]
MKHLAMFSITMLLLAAPILTHAQGFAVKAGANLSSWSGDDVESADVRMGYQLGLHYRARTSEKLSIVPGIQFTQRGVQDSDKETYDWYGNGTEVTYEYQMRVRANYLDFPLALEYQVDPSLYLIVRPMLSALLKNNYTEVYRECLDGECTGTKDEDEIDTFRSTDFSIGLGIGYLITRQIGFSVGYQWGLMTLDEEKDAEAFNRTVDFSLEYRF